MKTRSAVVRTKGSDLNNKKMIEGRARAKTITQSLALNLIEIARRKGNEAFEKSLRNTYYCQDKIHTKGKNGFSHYCKNKLCAVCQRNRKSDIINRYLPVISAWEDPHFVTLTVRSVSAKNLKKWMEKGMIRGIKLIIDRQRKRHAVGHGIKLIGIRSLECNFNPVKRTYNPHFHLIVPNAETAELFKNEWLKLWTSKHTSRKAQHSRKAVDLDHDLIETVKYGSKIFTEKDVNEKTKYRLDRKIYLKALYNILVSMEGLRLFDRFGFNLPPMQDKTIYEAVELIECEEWKYNSLVLDWVNTEHDEKLTEFEPEPALVDLLTNRLDKTLE